MSCIQVHRRRAQPTTASSRLMAQDVHHDGHDDADSTGDQELALWFCYNQALHGVQGWTRAGVDCLWSCECRLCRLMYKGKPVVLLRGRGLTDRALGIPWKSEHVEGENPRRRGSDGFWRLRQWCYLTGGVRDTISDVKWRIEIPTRRKI